METERNSVDLVGGATARSFARAAVLAALMGAAAIVTVPYPFSPAPITLQVLVVFLAGLYLGPVWGAGSIVLYLAAGAAGAPVFSGMTGGPGVLLGEPTAGFLWAFPVAAAAIGLIVHRRSAPRDPAAVPIPILIVGLCVGLVVAYAGGIAWYAWLTETSLVESALAVAVPFVPGDLLKMAAALAVVGADRIDV